MNTLESIIKKWVPDETDILHRHDGLDATLVYSARSGQLLVHRFFKIGDNWNVSEDVRVPADSVRHLNLST
jgi:hypothetical protein